MKISFVRKDGTDIEYSVSGLSVEALVDQVQEQIKIARLRQRSDEDLVDRIRRAFGNAVLTVHSQDLTNLGDE